MTKRMYAELREKGRRSAIPQEFQVLDSLTVDHIVIEDSSRHAASSSTSGAEDRPAHPLGQRLERSSPQMRVPRSVEARRPDRDRRLARRDRKDAAADAALAR